MRTNVTAEGKGAESPITIKKYANRRLYNTASSSYVTLDHLADMVKDGQDFVVYDAKTGEDITRSVLTQIIFEMEGKGQNMLPIRFLRQLIRFYGDSVQALVPGYLDMSMESFAKHQNDFRKQIAQAFGGAGALMGFEDQVRANMQLFERTMRMFSPFGTAGAMAARGESEAPGPEGKPAEMDELKERLETMQRQIDELSKK